MQKELETVCRGEPVRFISGHPSDTVGCRTNNFWRFIKQIMPPTERSLEQENSKNATGRETLGGNIVCPSVGACAFNVFWDQAFECQEKQNYSLSVTVPSCAVQLFHDGDQWWLTSGGHVSKCILVTWPKLWHCSATECWRMQTSTTVGVESPAHKTWLRRSRSRVAWPSSEQSWTKLPDPCALVALSKQSSSCLLDWNKLPSETLLETFVQQSYLRGRDGM